MRFAHVSHHTRNIFARRSRASLQRARNVGATLADAVWGTPSPRWRLCGQALSIRHGAPHQATSNRIRPWWASMLLLSLHELGEEAEYLLLLFDMRRVPAVG